jgi:filamentous hemagglutinin
MAVTRIKNNQITDATVVANAKLVDYSISSAKLANNLVYGSDLTISGNLTVNGNTTTIDTTITTIEDPVILLASGQTSGSPTVDIGFVGARGSSSNIAFVWNEANDEFVTAFTSTGETNTTVTITSYADFHTNNANIGGNLVIGGNIDIVGNIANVTVTGNVVGGNLLTQGVVSAAGNVTGGNVNTAGAVSATGTVTGGNVATAGNVSATGDVTGGNVATGGNVSATGNVTGGNVNTAGLVSATANVIGGNVLTAGLISSTGNLTSGNINTGGQIGATGNINSGANIVATANVIGGNLLTAGLISSSGNLTSGNIDTAGTVSATGNINSGANIVATANVIGGNISTAGQVTATGNVTGGNVLTGGLISSTGNVTGGNVLTGGLISSTGNVTGGNLLTTGLISTSGNVQGANIIATNAFIGNIDLTGDIVANSVTSNTFVSASGNVTGSNLFTAGNVSAAGNVTANNVNTDNVYSTAGLTITAASGDIALDTSGNINALNNYINNLLDPVQAQDAATKEYVDNAVSTGITIHEPVRLESPTALNATYVQGGTTATVTDTVAGNTVVFSSAISPQVNDQYWFSNSFNGVVANTPYFVVSAPNTSAAVLSLTYSGAPVTTITSGSGLTQGVRINSGQGATLTNAGANATLVIDGVTVSNTDRVLIYTQANAVHNGVYVVSEAGNATTAWQLTRSSDMDTYAPDDIDGLDAGDYFYVQQGDTGAGESYVMTAPIGPTIIGYANLTFTQFSASQVYTANTAAGLVLNGTVFSAKVDNNTTAFDGGGNISVKANANLTTPNIGAATGTSLSTTGNVTGGNILTAGLISTGGNISATGNVTAAYFIGEGSGLANISKIYNGTSYANIASANGNLDIQIAGGNTWSFNNLGEIVFPTGGTIKSVLSGGANTGISITTTGGQLSSMAHDANNYVFLNDDGVFLQAGAANNRVSLANTLFFVGPTTTVDMEVSGYLGVDEFISANGNIIGANISTSGLVTATGNITGGNILSGGSGSFTGNVTAANFIGNIQGNIDAGGSNTQVQFNDGDILNGTTGFTFDKTSNTVTVGGQITSTGTGNATTGAGQLYLNGSGNNRIDYNTNGTGAPAFTTRSAGTKVTLYPALSGSTTDYALGIDTATLWSSVPEATAGFYFKWYGATTEVASLSGTGIFSATGNITGANILTGGYVTATGNITGANLILTLGTIDGPAAGRITINGSDIDTDFAVDGDTVANVFYVDAGTGTASFGSSAQTVNAILSLNATNSVLMPVGNTAQRPATGVTGMLRFNTTDNNFEVYDNSQWSAVGVPEFTVIADDQFAGDGSTVAFTITADQTTNSCIVSINGVVQIPVTAYAVSGTTLTFTEAPQPGDVIDVRQITTTTTVTAISNSSGNAVIEVSDVSDNVNITGDLLPVGNLTQTLGASTNRWSDLWVGGNTIHLGALQLKELNPTTFAVFQADGITQANIDAGAIDVSAISSGTSAIGIYGTGQAYMTVNGNANVLVASNTGVAVTGTVSASGNITGSYILGNGSQLTGIDATSIQNGTANVRTFNNGNVTTSAAGTANVVVVTSTGTVTTGTVSATGNITGSYILGNGSQLTGIDATSIQSGTSNVRVVSSGGNVATGVGGTSNVVVVATTGQYVTGVVSVSGNILVNGTYINGVANPVQNQDVATKAYVDNQVSTAISYHQPVFATTNTTLATATGGTITYNQPNGAGNGQGATLTTTGSFNLIDTANVQTVGTRILVKNEANAVFNGVYTWANATNLVRATDSDTYGAGNTAAFGLNDYYFTTSGNVNAGSAFVVSAPTGTITFGTSNIAFAQFSSVQVYTANTQAGIVLNGTVASTKVDGVTTAFDGGGNISVKASANLTTPNIGAATGTSLSVTGTVTGASVVGGVMTGSSVSVTGTVIGAGITGTSLTVGTGTITGGNIVNSNANGVGNIGSSSTYFNTVFAKATSAQYADLAEKYVADAEYAPGTVLVFGGNAEVTVNAHDSDRRVAGVVSTNPSYIMNAGCEGTTVATVALTGRVPCFVIGPVRKGDMMVAAGLGRARAEADPRVGTVIGKALEDFDGTEGTIEVVVGRF